MSDVFTKMVQAGDYTKLVADAIQKARLEDIAIIQQYIQMLEAGHVKEGLREASKEEIEFATALLQAVAADIQALAARKRDKT